MREPRILTTSPSSIIRRRTGLSSRRSAVEAEAADELADGDGLAVSRLRTRSGCRAPGQIRGQCLSVVSSGNRRRRGMVPEVGLEPTLAEANTALNRARLPIPPLRQRVKPHANSTPRRGASERERRAKGGCTCEAMLSREDAAGLVAGQRAPRRPRQRDRMNDLPLAPRHAVCCSSLRSVSAPWRTCMRFPLVRAAGLVALLLSPPLRRGRRRAIATGACATWRPGSACSERPR